MAEDNIVYIGNKPTMNYVLAVTTQFTKSPNEVIIKARGMAISRAVDVAEVVRNRFVTEARIEGISISTEVLETKEGGKINVSSIEIALIK